MAPTTTSAAPVLDFVNGVYVCRCSFEQRAIPKEAKFWWHGGDCRPGCDACAAGLGKVWWTNKPALAVQLREIASPAAALALAPTIAAIDASRATDNTEADIPAPRGLQYLPFQRAGIALAATRPANLFADEPGLGKTIQAIGFVNCHDDVRRILVVCPATMKLVWRDEMTKWFVKGRSIKVVKGSGDWDGSEDVTIINFDLLAKYHDKLLATEWDLLIADECHYLKNEKAQRTAALYGRDSRKEPDKAVTPVTARYRICMSGTPLVNRPVELWSTIHYLDAERWSNFFTYAKRYCGAHKNGFGWDFSGATNLDELQRTLRASIMIRRLKKDVLTELPPKSRRIIPLEVSGSARKMIDAESQWWASQEANVRSLELKVELAKVSDNPDDYALAVSNLKNALRVAFSEMSAVRHGVAVAKIPAVIEYIEESVGDDEKVVIFAHHRDVIEALHAKLEGSVVVYGSTSAANRASAIFKFQNDPTCRYFIGGIYAAGTGITLTAAHRVIFAELDWVPGVMSQAEDRCHRIGQRDSVQVEHLVFDGSLDARMAKILVAKQDVLDRALDRDTKFVIPESENVLSVSGGTTRSTSRDKFAAVAAKLTDADVSLIHGALRRLAAMNEDHALELNGVGFNKLDTRIGEELAGLTRLTKKQAALGLKVVSKYVKTQLGLENPFDELKERVYSK